MKAAIIGTNWGLTHIQTLRDNQVEVTALIGVDGHKTRQLAAAHNIPHALTDTASCPTVDLFVVATPFISHQRILGRLPDIPVLCEKPLALTDDKLRQDLMARHSPVWVNYAFPFLHTAQTLKQVVEAGQIGRLRHISLDVSVNFPPVKSAAEWLLECAVHPLAFLLQMTGNMSVDYVHRAESPMYLTAVLQSEQAVMIDLTVRSQPETGLNYGLRLSGENGILTTTGGYAPGKNWSFAPVHLDGNPINAGEHSEWGDAWYWANKLSVGSVCDALRSGASASVNQPMQWQSAYEFENHLLNHALFQEITDQINRFDLDC